MIERSLQASSRPKDWRDYAAFLLLVVTMMVVTFTRLPLGVCFGDAGGLQLAATTLGITHPPGYPGYAALGYLYTLVPGISPAFQVTTIYWVAGLSAMTLGVWMQVRLGVNHGVAVAVMLLWMIHGRVFPNLVGPEVYMLSLTLVVAATYALMKFADGRRKRSLALAAFLFGFALANRPPVALLLPFVLAGWWMAHRRSNPTWRESVRSLGLATGCALIPVLFSFAYVWVRDTPATPYNYIDQYNHEFNILPQSDEGLSAKFERAWWHLSGAQFRSSMGNSVTGVTAKLRWVWDSVIDCGWWASTLGAMLVGFGAVVAFRRSVTGFLMMLGMIVQSLVFVCLYRVYGQAADLLPLLFASAVLGGVAISYPIGQQRRWVGLVIAVGASAAVLYTASQRTPDAGPRDAQQYLIDIDMPSLPRNAVICTMWETATPLWYAQHVLSSRDDILIINAAPTNWLRLIQPHRARPIFMTEHREISGEYDVVPFRNLFRLVPKAKSGELSPKIGTPSQTQNPRGLKPAARYAMSERLSRARIARRCCQSYDCGRHDLAIRHTPIPDEL